MFKRSLVILTVVICLNALAACSSAALTSTPQPTAANAESLSSTPTVTSASESYRGYIRFDHYGLTEGLSQSTVNCIVQDAQGFMWFGTQDGLNRFDGYDFKVYTTEPNNSHSLSDRWITALAEDKNGNLWIGTRLGGLNLFTSGTGNFSHYRHTPENPVSLSSNNVTSLLQDKDGTLWVGTTESLDKLNFRMGTFTHYYNQPDKPNTPGANQINAIFQDTRGTIWVATNGGGLAKFDPSTGKFVHYTHENKKSTSISNDYIYAIAEEPRNKLWVVTAIGLNLFDPSNEIFTHFVYSPDRPNGISSNNVLTVFVDHAGSVWIGTKNGLDRLDRTTGKFKHYGHDPAIVGTMSSNDILSIYEDRSEGLWIGTFGGGINQYNRQQENFIYYHHDPNSIYSLSNDLVFGFFVEDSGIAWIGTYGGGLDRLNPMNEQFTHFRNDPADPTTLINNYVWSVYRDKSGRLWVGTEGGLDLYNDKTGQFTHYVHSIDNPESIASNTVHKIFEDRTGNLWIGTSLGLDRFDPTTETFSHYSALNDTGGVTRDDVISIMEDRQGFIWVGTFNKGLYRLDRSYYAFAFYQYDPQKKGGLSNNSVLCIFQDRDANIWIGTSGGGLNKYDPVSDTFTAYIEKDGLPSGVVYSILQDDQGFLWLSTNNGVSRFDPQTKTFKNFTTSSGLQSDEFSMGAYARGNDGAIYLGGVNGFNVFYPDRVLDNTYVPPVVLTALTQDSKPIQTQNTVEFTRQITLQYPKNSFEFEFTALNYSEPGKNQFAYMLEKFDSGWNLIGNKRFGRYTNLPGGKYTLRLKVANNDGVWNDTGQSITVTVIPPFWQTWWFRVLVVIGVVAAAFGIYQIRTNSIKRRNLELERLVKVRTQEMERLFEKTKELAVIEERNRLARVLHDSAKQKAFAAMAQIGTANGTIQHDQAATRKHLIEAENLVYEVIQELTFLIQEMYPLALKEKGLETTLREYVFEWENRNDICVNVQIKYAQRLPLNVEQALYRIVQESLANIARHSCAANAEVTLRYDGNDVAVTVVDNGCGFDTSSKFGGLGLRLIRERAESIGGKVTIDSSFGKGTKIDVRLTDQKPLNEESVP
jgi:ligand-binding sensor domain-containing protein/signal transduction histidine kinase